MAIVLHNFELSPFVAHPNNHAADASLDDGRAPMLPINDCCIDRFVAHLNFAVDALVGLDVDLGLVDAANEPAVASTFVEFVVLKPKRELFAFIRPNFDIQNCTIGKER